MLCCKFVRAKNSFKSNRNKLKLSKTRLCNFNSLITSSYLRHYASRKNFKDARNCYRINAYRMNSWISNPLISPTYHFFPLQRRSGMMEVISTYMLPLQNQVTIKSSFTIHRITKLSAKTSWCVLTYVKTYSQNTRSWKERTWKRELEMYSKSGKRKRRSKVIKDGNMIKNDQITFLYITWQSQRKINNKHFKWWKKDYIK